MGKRKNMQITGQIGMFGFGNPLDEVVDLSVPELPAKLLEIPSDNDTITQDIVLFDDEFDQEKKSDKIVNIIIRNGKPVDYAPNQEPQVILDKDDRLEANILALKELEVLIASNQYATADQQDAIAAYTGWEGMYSSEKTKEAIRTRLAAEFSDEQAVEVLELPQYPFAPSSRATQSIYKSLAHIGFKNGNVLLSGTGTGTLVRHMPAAMRLKSRITIDATDGVVGDISSLLFPEIEVIGAQTLLPDSFYDIAIGIVPFTPKGYGNHVTKRGTISLPNYACQMARALAALRPEGFYLMLVESKRTDKDLQSTANPFSLSTSSVNLVGAVRLETSAMNNEVGYDLLVFQKVKDKNKSHDYGIFTSGCLKIDYMPKRNNDMTYINISRYFISNADCMLGDELVYINNEAVVTSIADEKEYAHTLAQALKAWNCKNIYAPVAFDSETEDADFLPANPNIKNFSMVVINGKVYQRIDSKMIAQKLSDTQLLRVKGLICVRDLAVELVKMQLNLCADEDLKKTQAKLNYHYDKFVERFGPVTNQTNTRLFREDAEYCFVAALERIDEEDRIQKTDIFTKRTVMVKKEVLSCDTIDEAYTVCIDQKARVDIDHIAMLCGQSNQEVIENLAGRLIYKLPSPESGEDEWVSHDSYLSGNTRKKLAEAEAAAEHDPSFQINVDALLKVVPPLIPAKDIFVKLGQSYISTEIVSDFIYEVLGEKKRGADSQNFSIRRKASTDKWIIKSEVYIPTTDPNFYQGEYGTEDYSALWLIEKMLNVQQIVAYKDETDPLTGEKKRVKDQDTTVVLGEKADNIQRAFKKWIFTDPVREAQVVDDYNKTYNTNTIPKYDGSHLTFPGMTAAIELKPHQKNAVYRIIRENGALIAHVVGSGKTITLLAAGMELKRLGRISKPLYEVPNNLLSQWGGEMMRLYPTANILIADPTDMQKGRRERFLSRMATGNYDAIIMGTSSFIQVPPPFQSIVDTVDTWKEAVINDRGLKSKTVDLAQKKMEDEELTFFKRCQVAPYTMEDLGIDFLFLDESHEYKNLATKSSYGDVKGLVSSGAAKCSDMYYKTKYMSSLHGGKGGFVFATGTPITNTIVEMYSLQRYFQEKELLDRKIFSLDDWLNIFGEITNDWELPPEGLSDNGVGFRRVSRVSAFSNLPELMSMVLQFMDNVTRDEIDMETPAPIRKTILCQPSLQQKSYMNLLVERANRIRTHGVRPCEDNMLLVTVDGRKSALDTRLVVENGHDYEHNKINMCAKNVYDNYKNYNAIKATQLVFSDISTPTSKGFHVYGALKKKLVEKGIPEDEIAFAHEFDTVSRKTSMRLKMQTGKLRVLIGSTATIGQGMNIQNRLIALHNLDVPWVPKDLEQREGRILRPGNMHSSAFIYSYVTEGSFDAYMWQLVEVKAKLIAQIMRGDINQRRIEDIDTKVLSYAEIKAIATGNGKFLERAKIEGELVRLETLRREFIQSKETLKQNVYKNLPRTIANLESLIPRIEADLKAIECINEPSFTINGTAYALTLEKEDLLIKALAETLKTACVGDEIGTFYGMSVRLYQVHSYSLYRSEKSIVLNGNASHHLDDAAVYSGQSIIRACWQTIKSISGSLKSKKEVLKANCQALEAATSLLNEQFEHEDRLNELTAKRDQLSNELAQVA